MIQFSTAQIQDAEKISNLVNSAYRGESSKVGWTTEADLLGGQRTDREKIVEMIEEQDLQIELAIDSETQEIIGCVYIRNEKPETLYFGMLVVNPGLQAKGLGKNILAHVEQLARSFGAKKIKLSVIPMRTELVSFYERRGFVKTGNFEEFPADDPRFGIPKRDDLQLMEMVKLLD